jgi:hypothetical protein
VAQLESDPRSRAPFAWLLDWLRHWRRPFAWLLEWWLRSWRRMALALLILVAALLVVRAALDLWAGRELNAEVARLGTVYGRLDPATLALPRVPPSENRARVMRAAASLLSVDDAERKALDWFYLRSGQPSTGLSDDLQRLAGENRFAEQVAGEGRGRPKSNWEIDYAHNDRNFPRLREVRDLGTVLSLSCRAAVDAGHADEAAGTALTGLAEAASFGGEPNDVLQLTRMGIVRDQMMCVRDLLERNQPSAAVLTDVAQALAESRTPDPVHTAFIGELKDDNQLFAQMERGDYVGVSVGGRYGDPNQSPTWAAQLVTWLCRPLIRLAHGRYLAGMARIIALQRVVPSARQASADDARPKTTWQPGRWWQIWRRLDETLVADLANLGENFLAGHRNLADSGYLYTSQLNAAELAVALRRFRLDRGTYPDALAELAPRYLAQVPIDPITGHPPEYTRQGEGFELRGHAPKWMGEDDSPLLAWKISR